MSWVKVCWANGSFGMYDITVIGTQTLRKIAWRRYSVLPPFYTFGAFDSTTTFYARFVCEPYCDFWFDLTLAEQCDIQPSLGNDGTRKGLTPCFAWAKWGFGP